MIIRILRHGETEYNRDWRFLGQKDLPLTAEGRAALFASGERPARVFVSGLRRTRETAEIIFPGAEYIAVPGLNEMDFGDFEGKTWMDMKEDPVFKAWIGSERFTQCPGGEGRAEFSGRICEALIKIIGTAEAAGEQQVTIVAHGGTVMSAMERFCTDRPGQYTQWRLGNGEGFLLEGSGKGAGMRWHVRRRLSYVRNAGRVHLYYGDGRGKTSLAMGTALRALQRGWKVRVLQFCKNAGSSETALLQKLGAEVFYGKEVSGFVSSLSPVQKEQLAERQTAMLAELMERFRGEEAGSGQLLILDEACAALEYAVLDEALLWDSVLRKPSRLEMILTGRHPADWMLRAADYATELKETAHPLQDGLPARCGIEY